MHIIENLYIKPDVIGYQLIRKDKNKKGIVVDYICGYYYTVRSAMDGAVRELERMAMIDGTVGEVKDYIGKLYILEQRWAEGLSNDVISRGMKNENIPGKVSERD